MSTQGGSETKPRPRSDEDRDDDDRGPKTSQEHASDEKHNDADEKEDKPQTPEEKRKAKRKKWVILIIVAIVVVIGLIIAIPWWLHERHFESSDDAFIDAHSERLAPQIAGRVTRVLADDNDEVSAGQVIVEIDRADVTVTIEQAKAMIAEAQGRLAQAKAQEQSARATVEESQATVKQAQVSLDNARATLQRYEGLSAEAISRQRLDDLRTAARDAAAELTAKQGKLGADQAQIAVAQSQEQAAVASIQAARAQLDSAQLQLSYTSVKAGTAGRVTMRGVQVGDYVRIGQQLMIIVPHNVWVTANYKENQLNDIRPGQPVEIEVDAFSNHRFHGKVQSIQAGAGAWFSVLPPENATGNYVKVVQRVPVKIVFDDTSGDAYARLAPGMSVVPKIRVR